MALAAPFTNKTLEQWGRLAELPRWVHPLIVNRISSPRGKLRTCGYSSSEEKESALAAIKRGDSIEQVVDQFQLDCSRPPKRTRKKQPRQPEQATSQPQSQSFKPS